MYCITLGSISAIDFVGKLTDEQDNPYLVLIQISKYHHRAKIADVMENKNGKGTILMIYGIPHLVAQSQDQKID